MKTFGNMNLSELTQQELVQVNGGSVATYVAGYSAGATLRQWFDNLVLFRTVIELL